MAQIKAQFELTNIDKLKESLIVSQKLLILMQENITSLQASIDLANSFDISLTIKYPIHKNAPLTATNGLISRF